MHDEEPELHQERPHILARLGEIGTAITFGIYLNVGTAWLIVFSLQFNKYLLTHQVIALTLTYIFLYPSIIIQGIIVISFLDTKNDATEKFVMLFILFFSAVCIGPYLWNSYLFHYLNFKGVLPITFE